MSLHLVTGYAGREHVTSADHGSFNIAFVGAGEYVFDRADMFEATIIDETHVRIGSGDILMQGRHIRQMENTQTTLTFDAGVAGLYRKDMVVAEYNKDNTTKIESARFNIIKGTSAESESSAVLPSYTHGDITEENSDLVNQMPLFEVDFSGIDIVDVKPLYTVMQGYDHALDELKDEGQHVIDTVMTALQHSFENAQTEFLANGNIEITYDNRKLIVIFNNDGSITEQLKSVDGTTLFSEKVTTFNNDGSITETVTYPV